MRHGQNQAKSSAEANCSSEINGIKYIDILKIGGTYKFDIILILESEQRFFFPILEVYF